MPNTQLPVPMNQQTQTAQLLASLARQESLLQQIITSLNKPKLGLHSDAGICKIYCNRQHGSLWYTLSDGNPTPVTASALTGFIKELRFEKVERRGKEVHKLLTTIEGDKLYILESGHDSHFSKGLLSAIAILTPDQLHQPITISPQAGDDESVLFCRLYVNNEYVKVQYSDATDWRTTAKKAIDNVKALTQVEF